MTTKNDRPDRLSQILESSEADQWYPVWEKEKVWDKIIDLSQPAKVSQKQRYWLWFIAISLTWTIPGADPLPKAPRPQVEYKAPIAQVEAPTAKVLIPTSIAFKKNILQLEQKQPRLSNSTSITPPVMDTMAIEAISSTAKFQSIAPILSLNINQEVHSNAVKLQLPPRPWRKKHSTLYTLKIPETPLNWNVYNTYVRHVDQQIKAIRPINGWMAFQVHHEAGTAFTLVYRSPDTLRVKDIEIHIRTNNR